MLSKVSNSTTARRTLIGRASYIFVIAFVKKKIHPHRQATNKISSHLSLCSNSALSWTGLSVACWRRPFSSGRLSLPSSVYDLFFNLQPTIFPNDMAKLLYVQCACNLVKQSKSAFEVSANESFESPSNFIVDNWYQSRDNINDKSGSFIIFL